MPFSNSTEADYWFSKNCHQCQKYNDTMPDMEETLRLLDDGQYCPLQWGIEKAMFERFDKTLLNRIGINNDGGIASRCLEKITIEAVEGVEKIITSPGQTSLF
jgi:hypothetical protein